MGTLAGVRPISESSIEIDFRYRGVRCRERYKLAPTPRNMAYASRERGAILNEIALGTFDYSKRFPDSPQATKLSRRKGADRTVEDALNDWYDRMARKLQHSTLIGHERSLKNVLIPVFGSIKLREFKRSQLRAWADEQVMTAKRLNNLIAPLRKAFAAELEDENIEANPITGFKFGWAREADVVDPIDPFTPDELRTIWNHCDGQVKNLFQFAVATGLRTSELIALQWKDVELDKGLVHVRAAFVLKKRKATKTKRSERAVQLLGMARAALEAQRPFTEHKGGAVFDNPKTDSPWMTDKQIRVWNWKPILKRAGVRYRYPYQLRHTFASTALSAGENLYWVSTQMGHADASVTQKRYTRFIKAAASDSGSKMEALWKSE